MRVLVCDDDPTFGDFLCALLQAENWQASAVTSGESCLAALQQADPPDVLVLDQLMPGLLGLDVAARLRRSGYARPIVLCSGHLEPAHRKKADRLKLIQINKLDTQALVRVVAAAASADAHPSLTPAGTSRERRRRRAPTHVEHTHALTRFTLALPRHRIQAGNTISYADVAGRTRTLVLPADVAPNRPIVLPAAQFPSASLLHLVLIPA